MLRISGPGFGVSGLGFLGSGVRGEPLVMRAKHAKPASRMLLWNLQFQVWGLGLRVPIFWFLDFGFDFWFLVSGF